jgi:hypothetical protein
MAQTRRALSRKKADALADADDTAIVADTQRYEEGLEVRLASTISYHVCDN